MGKWAFYSSIFSPVEIVTTCELRRLLYNRKLFGNALKRPQVYHFNLAEKNVLKQNMILTNCRKQSVRQLASRLYVSVNFVYDSKTN